MQLSVSILAGWLFVAALFALVPAAGHAAAPVDQQSLLIFAAASTKEVVDDVLKEFQLRHPTIEVKASFGSSAALARQLQAGAGADLFLSANKEWIDELDQQQMVAERCNLLGNELVVVVPLDSSLGLTRPQDLLRDDVRRIAAGEPDSVPAGIYARQALHELKLWDRIKAKVAGASDVRHALAFVETGACEAGIVYATDAAMTKRVKIAFKFDVDLTEPIVYPLGLLKASAGKPAARQLYAAFQTDSAAKIYERRGFSVRLATTQRQP